MRNTEVAAQIARTGRFLGKLRAAISATVVDGASLYADDQHRGLERIGATLDQVDYALLSDLATIDAAMGGGMLDLIEVHLKSVGGGPTLDYADAAAFLAGFVAVVEAARRRPLH